MPATHHPPHVYLDNTWYMLTASTYQRQPALSEYRAKVFAREQLKSLVAPFGVSLKAWVILDDHYHLLLRITCGADLPRFVGRLHGSISRQVNAWAQTLGRRLWDNYWDTCMRTEDDLWRRFNYIHQNPVKHGYVGELAKWEFSSYPYYLRERGKEWLADCWATYPVVDYVQFDEFGSRGGPA